MEQRLKQRLIGAVVLVALAVIFVPMLLQGPVEREPTDVPIEIPPKPVVNVAPPAAAPTAEQAAAPIASAPFTSSRPADEATTQVQAAALAPVAAEPQAAASKPAAAEPPKPAAPVSAQEPLSTASRAPSDLAAWAVQVGSFGTEANARGLRDSLRKKGYSAYVESIKSDGNTFYRVRVGPAAQREEAERLQATLAKKESMKGLVVPHP